MKNLLTSTNTWTKFLLFALTVAAIVYIIPKEGKFKYEFEKGKPWKHKDLQAEFTYAVDKTTEQIEDEKLQIKSDFKPFFNYNDEALIKSTDKFNENIKEALLSMAEQDEGLDYYKNEGQIIISDVLERGLIWLPKNLTLPENGAIRVIENQRAENRLISEFYNYSNITTIINSFVDDDSLLNRDFFKKSLRLSIKPNIEYDKDLSETKLEEQLNSISPSMGLVQEGEKIISKGNIVDEEKYRKLASLKKEYESNLSAEGQIVLILGYSFIVLLILGIFAYYLLMFKHEVFLKTKSVILIIINILIFVFVTSYISVNTSISVYVIPFNVATILLLAFFGPRVAIMSHLVIILIAALIVPNSFEFFFLQMMSGFTAVLTMSRIRYLSQFFVAAILIVLTYYLCFIGLRFIQVGSIYDINWMTLLWFSINFILTLLAYPLIYAVEKLFGFVSDITLIELGDINKKLLRKLAMKAPGTFQHSLQVANLCENVLSEIGGNALLARVAALYHDIGKMDKPQYFIENQKYINNPHDLLSDEESAKVIIEHVTKGVEIAKQKNLPEEIIEFIRTHHGTSRVEFFYRNYLKSKELQSGDIDDTNFRYPGPKPYTKEMAVMMIVDSIEAASRSIKEPNEEKLDNLVDQIIESKLDDHQLDEADISMKEVNTIKMRLKKLLKSIYHVRVEYPDEQK